MIIMMIFLKHLALVSRLIPQQKKYSLSDNSKGQGPTCSPGEGPSIICCKTWAIVPHCISEFWPFWTPSFRSALSNACLVVSCWSFTHPKLLLTLQNALIQSFNWSLKGRTLALGGTATPWNSPTTALTKSARNSLHCISISRQTIAKQDCIVVSPYRFFVSVVFICFFCQYNLYNEAFQHFRNFGDGIASTCFGNWRLTRNVHLLRIQRNALQMIFPFFWIIYVHPGKKNIALKPHCCVTRHLFMFHSPPSRFFLLETHEFIQFDPEKKKNKSAIYTSFFFQFLLTVCVCFFFLSFSSFSIVIFFLPVPSGTKTFQNGKIQWDDKNERIFTTTRDPPCMETRKFHDISVKQAGYHSTFPWSRFELPPGRSIMLSIRGYIYI